MATPNIPFNNDEALRLETEAFYAADTFAFDTIGMKIIAAQQDHSFVSMPIAPHLFNAKGGLQGGALFALADLAAAIADYRQERLSTTVDASIQYLKVPTGNEVYAHAYCLRCGKTLGYIRVDLLDEKNDIIAVASFTYYHFQAKP